MNLQMIGCSHKDAAVEFREQLAFTDDQSRQALSAFRGRFPAAEIVLLSTCNRVELYVAAGSEKQLPAVSEIVQFLGDQHGMDPDHILAHISHRSGVEVVEHLFTVAAALDSLVVGEAQILNQVKQAYDRATEAGATGPLTHVTFQAANRVAKRVQHETTIHRRRVSIPSVAVGEVAPEFFETLVDKRVLLIGAGEMGAETMRYLQDAGARDIRIANRSPQRSAELAERLGAASVPWETLLDQMVQADLIVSTTGSTEPIVSTEQFKNVHSKRFERLLLILDLAVPRDFEAAIGELPGVYLYSVDDLQSSADRNRREREKEWPKALKIISEETSEFVRLLETRATGPVIKQLRDQAESIKKSELERLLKRLERAETPEKQHAEVTQAFDRLVNKLLHPPLASLRDDAASGHRLGLLEAMRRLFQLTD